MEGALLNWLIFIPAIGALLCLLVPSAAQAKKMALVTTLVTLAINVFLAYRYYGQGFQGVVFEKSVLWIDNINVFYRVGVDGLSMPLILLASALSVLVVMASWRIEKATKAFMALYLFLMMGMYGVFLALDLFLFYVFFEISLVPMYFLIGVWGGPRKEYAAIKFFLFTLAGSICLLVVMLGLYFLTPKIAPGDAGPESRSKPIWHMVSSDPEALTLQSDRVRAYFGPRPSETTLQIPGTGDVVYTADHDEVAVAAIEKSLAGGADPVAVGDAVVKGFMGDHGSMEFRDATADRLRAVASPEGGHGKHARADHHGDASGHEGAISQILADAAAHAAGPWTFAMWAFWLTFIAFAIKIPVAPFHTWLPDAHVEAPTPISMILAGVLLKMGGYALMRITYPVFPDAAMMFWVPVAAIGVFSILYGALCSLAQTDWKKLVAYSSVSHMGYVTLGIAVLTRTGFDGAYFQMIAHGITSAMMFFLVGVLYDRAHHREINRLGGLWLSWPGYGGWSLLGFFAGMGLPGLCGFIGEIMVLLGTFEAAGAGNIGAANIGVVYTLGILAASGVVLTAAYILWMFQRVYMGLPRPEYENYEPVVAREYVIMATLGVAAIVFGVVPYLVFGMTNPTFDKLLGIFSL